MRRVRKRVAAVLVFSAVLAMGIGVSTGIANASGTGTTTPGTSTSWTIPTSPMTNTIVKDGKTYKVLTSWENNFSTSGSDYLGISNSCFLVSSGRDNNPKDLQTAQQESMLGVWASEANEEPNAYNWNTFYNLYADTQSGMTTSDLATTNTFGWDSTSGTWSPFKYRPEVMFTDVYMYADADQDGYPSISTAVGYINDEEYYTSSSDYSSSTPTASGTDNDYYVSGDENYNPFVVIPNDCTALTWIDSLYEMASDADAVIETTADYTSDSSATGWKDMNSLPRTNRYEETPTECALNYEKVTRGAVYYVLSKIADGTVKRKKVAFLTGDPTDGSTTVTVAAYDFIESNNGGDSGCASFTPLVVNQLTTDTKVGVYGNQTSIGNSGTTYYADTPYTTYTATADELASCDIVYNPKGSYTAAQLENWIQTNATTEADKTAAENIQYMTAVPATMTMQGWMIEKASYGAYTMGFFYPELFPNMELLAFWYDEIYHLKTDALSSAMSWGCANASMPSGTSLGNLASGYSLADMNEKFKEGYEYYAKHKDDDATLSRVLANEDLSGSTTYTTSSTSGTYDFSDIEPSDTYKAWAAGKAITGTTTYNKTVCDSPFTLDLAASGSTFTYASSDTSVVKVSSSGKVTIVGKGDAIITAIANGDDSVNSVSKTVVVKVSGPKTTQISYLKSKKAGQLTVKVKKIAGATGYKIWYRVGSKTKTVSTTSLTTLLKKMKKNKTYKVKARAYKKLSGKTYYGSYSKVKSAKIKK